MSTDVAEVNTALLRKRRRSAIPGRPLGDKRDRGARRFIRSVAEIDDEQDLRNTILSRLRRAVEVRRTWEEDWHRIVMAWFQKPVTEKEEGWESNRYMPIIFKHIETATPMLVAATLDPKGIFKMEAARLDAREAAQNQTWLVNWQIDGPSRGLQAYERMYFWSSLIGTAYIEHYWDFQRERRMVPKVVVDPQTGKRVKRMLEAEIVVANHPRIVCLNPVDVWPDPDSENGDDNEWYIVRTRATLGELHAFAKQGGHIDKDALEKWIEDADPGNQTEEGDIGDPFAGESTVQWNDWLREADLESRATETREDDESDGEKRVTLLRYVSKHETVTMGDREHIIGFNLNPNLHGKTGIITHQCIEIPNSPFGRGFGHVLLGHQELANLNINLWMDTAMMELMAPVAVDKSKVSVLEEDFVWEPNKLIRMRGTDGIKRLEVPAPTALAMQIDAHLARDADDATGFTQQARGAQGPTSQTATLTNTLTTNLNTRLILMIRRGARTLQRSGELLKTLNMQYLNETQMVTLRGEEALDYREIAPEDIVGDTVVRVTVNAGRANPEMVSQRLIQAIQIVTPLIVQGLHKDPTIQPLLRALFTQLEIDNADLLFPKAHTLARDPLKENAFMALGNAVHAIPSEDHWSHAQAHAQGRREAEAAGAPAEVLAVFDAHLQEHMDLAAQMGAAQSQAALGAGNPNPSAAGIRSQTPAGVAGDQAGASGVPGAAAPGPGAPMGRPM